MQNGLVLVNGAGGFVGSHVVEVLREAGYEVRATDLPGTDSGPALAAGAEWVEADLLEPGAARRVVKGARGVVNVAGIFDFSMPWDTLYGANVQVSDNMCEAALEARVDKFVHISASAIYGPPKKIPAGEDAPQEPDNDYEKTKLLGEQKVWHSQRFKGLPATILRPAMIYGPRSQYIVATIMALYALGKEQRYPWLKEIRGGALCHHVHVRDVANASLILLRKAEATGTAYNVADSTPIRWGELVQYISDLTRYKGEPLPLYGPLKRIAAVAGAWMPSSRLISLNKRLNEDWTTLLEREGLETPLAPRLDRGMLAYMSSDRVCDTSVLQRLGFSPSYPVTLTGLSDTFDWYMKQGWLPGKVDLAQN